MTLRGGSIFCHLCSDICTSPSLSLLYLLGIKDEFSFYPAVVFEEVSLGVAQFLAGNGLVIQGFLTQPLEAVNDIFVSDNAPSVALRHLKIPEREDNVALRKLSEIVTANNSEANFVVVGSHIDRAFSYLGVFVEDTFWTVRSFE